MLRHIAVGLALAAAGLALVACGSSHAAPSPAAPVSPQAAQVDKAVALDGLPNAWPSGDAYAFVAQVCAFMRDNGTTAVNWHETGIAGLMTKGGLTAMQVGAPIVCPDISAFITASADAFLPTAP